MEKVPAKLLLDSTMEFNAPRESTNTDNNDHTSAPEVFVQIPVLWTCIAKPPTYLLVPVPSMSSNGLNIFHYNNYKIHRP